MSETFDSDKLAQEMKRRERYIEKLSVQCSIMTTAGEIKGEVYRRGGTRIIDELNLENPFIAVTNASFTNGKDGKPVETNFMVLRMEQIVWILPANEERNNKKS